MLIPANIMSLDEPHRGIESDECGDASFVILFMISTGQSS